MRQLSLDLTHGEQLSFDLIITDLESSLAFWWERVFGPH